VNSEILIGEPAELGSIFMERLSRALHGRSQLAVALPGGSVAERFFPVMAASPFSWEAVHLFWCDERAVPPGHPDSNYRLASELLLRRIDVDTAHVHRMKAETVDLESASADYEGELRSTLGHPPRLDLALLGVGPDGHVCSLFPGHPALDEKVRRVVAIYDSPKPPARRMTLTLAALEDAEVVIAAFGASKATAIRDALENPASRLPVALAARVAKRALFLLDADAAGR
jgi:6-phosphogluconolactonase